MGQNDIENAQVRVNSICNDFAKLGYPEVIYPEIIKSVNDITDLKFRTEIEEKTVREGFQFRKASYIPFVDKIYILRDLVNSKNEKDLRTLIYHELLHRVGNIRRLKNECILAYFKFVKNNQRYALAMLASQLSEHFDDIIVEKTLREKHGIDTSDSSRSFDSKLLELWKLGPIKRLREFEEFDQNIKVIFWLVEGIEIYVHGYFNNEDTCRNALKKKAPKLLSQLENLFNKLTIDTETSVIMDIFKNLCGIATLNIEYVKVPLSEFQERFLKLSGIYSAKEYLCPFVQGPKQFMATEILSNISYKGKY